MKKITIAIALVLLAAQTSAQNVTQSVLEAKFVENFVRIKPVEVKDEEGNRKKALHYAIDSYNVDDMKPLDGVSFRVDGPVMLLLADHNPVLELYTIKRTRKPDPNHEALKALFDEVTALQKTLPVVQTTGAGGPPNETAAQRKDRIEKSCKEKFKNETDAKKKEQAILDCVAQTEDDEACALFASLIKEAVDALRLPALAADRFSTTVDNASGFQGVSNLRKFITDTTDTIKKNNDKVRGNLKQINETFGAGVGAEPLRTCSKISSIILINYSELVARAETIMARKEELSRELQKLHKSLDDYADADNWRGPTDATRTDYLAEWLRPTAEEQEDVSISLEKQDVKAADLTFSITKVKDSAVSGEFPIRRDSFFTIERAMGAIYNSLEYPQYGTGPDENGVTVVKKKDDHKPIDAAVMFNFIPRLRSISGAYPMFQIGFSSAKDFPGLLAGVGVRIVGRFPLSLSAGGLITRYKDLDGTLKVNDPVSGTAEINDHLVYKTSPVAWYGGIQLKF